MIGLDVKDILDQIKSIDNQINELNEQKAELRNYLITEMKNRGISTLSLDDVDVRYIEPSVSKILDKDKVIAFFELNNYDYDEFMKESKRKETIQIRFK